LPKVGDYQTVDWEALQSLRPSVIIIQMQPDRMPAGFKERADAIGATLTNVKFDRLDEVFDTIDRLGTDLDLQAQAATARQRLHTQLDAVRARAAGDKPVRTLIVTGDSTNIVAGPDTYLDDLLHWAGGVNAAADLKTAWPQVDREMLMSLKPDAIIQLLPNASAQAKAQAAAKWARLPQIPAVAAGRVYTIDAWYAELPGWHVGDLATTFAECLHPSTPSSSPTTNRATP